MATPHGPWYRRLQVDEHEYRLVVAAYKREHGHFDHKLVEERPQLAEAAVRVHREVKELHDRYPDGVCRAN